MVAAREPRVIAGFRYEEIINVIDWDRILIQAIGLHEKLRAEKSERQTCGECIRSVLLRFDE